MVRRGAQSVARQLVMNDAAHIKALRRLGGTLKQKLRTHTIEKQEHIEPEMSFVCVLCISDVPCGLAGCCGTWIGRDDVVNALPGSHLDSDDDVAWRSAISDAYSIPTDEI